jgi:hypothetical protein
VGGLEESGPAASVAPQPLQNREAGGGMAPQPGHVTASFAPHSLQKVEPAGGWWLHWPQIILVSA